MSDSAVVPVNVELGTEDWKVGLKMTVPVGPMERRELLPLAQGLADFMVGVAEKGVAEKGESISCKKGCGACCRQLVPISEMEARRIREVVDALPEPRRSEVRARFAEGRRRLAEADVLEKLERRTTWQAADFRTFGLEYFQAGVPCPFLEEESCSIYADRPVTCREYLVTSPPENCSRPTAAKVRRVSVPLRVLPGLTRLDPVPTGTQFARWVPLILAPEWAAVHPDEPEPRPGPELVRQLIANLSNTDPNELPPFGA